MSKPKPKRKDRPVTFAGVAMKGGQQDALGFYWFSDRDVAVLRALVQDADKGGQ